MLQPQSIHRVRMNNHKEYLFHTKSNNIKIKSVCRQRAKNNGD